MNQQQWQKVREIFDSALRREPEERSHFVSEVCGDDKVLRAEVESLLSSLNSADSFLETPAVAKIADAFDAEKKQFEAGKSFAHYEIVKQIGAGGMGEVYLAKDEKLDRKVAVKILNEEFSRNESNLKRFAREAKAASALNHPNILVIHEIGESGDQPFFVSEYVQGKTLRETMREKKLPLVEILEIAVQIANALAAAHEISIIHRDIKPENVMIRPDGFVKILDFGLAKLVECKSNSFIGADEKTAGQNDTAQGVILGTINYMSPEQAKGERVDERTDVFSLGILLYEMIAGEKPFAGDSNSETLANLLKAEPLPLSNYAANVSEELQRVIDKTLNKNKDERYQTMRELLADLKDLRQDLEFQAKAERSRAPDIKRIDLSGKNLLTRQEISENKSTGANVATISTTDDIAPPSTSAGYVVREIKQHKRSVLAALAIPIALATVWSYLFESNRANPITGVKIRSVAVLPLKPINQGRRDELYEVGVADSLIQRFSSIKNFVVRPLSAVRKYTDPELDPLAAGREQQVDYVLASNYQIAGGKIRVTSQLFNVENGQTEETYKTEKDTKDVFAVQDAIAEDVGNLLRARFNVAQSNPTARRGTDNEEAYRLYLQGMYFYDRRTKPDAEKAVEVLTEAVRLDPNYARAWAGLAHAHRYLMNLDITSNLADESRKVTEALNRALALDDTVSEAYSASCDNKLNYEYDFAAAETACRRAIELKPESAVAHNIYARFLMSRARFDESISEIKTAIDLEPTSYFHQIVYAVCLIQARRYNEAFRQTDRLAELNPPNAYKLYYGNNGALMTQENSARAFDRTIRYMKLANADEQTLQLYQTIYQTVGWQGVLREQARRLEENPLEHYFYIAANYAQIGDKDKALELLEKSFQRREFWMVYLQTEPRLDSLRNDPRFEALIEKVEAK